jgi:hypothetical protein
MVEEFIPGVEISGPVLGNDAPEVLPLIHKYGGLEYATEKARFWALKAEGQETAGQATR